MDNERQRTIKWIYAVIAVVLILVTIVALAFATENVSSRALAYLVASNSVSENALAPQSRVVFPVAWLLYM